MSGSPRRPTLALALAHLRGRLDRGLPLSANTARPRLKICCGAEQSWLSFDLGDELCAVLDLMDKYADVPMSLADACLVRMSETLPDPVVLTTDADFKIYRRHSRQVVPCLLP